MFPTEPIKFLIKATEPNVEATKESIPNRLVIKQQIHNDANNNVIKAEKLEVTSFKISNK